MHENRDWSRSITPLHTVSAWCTSCYGSGQQRKRHPNGIFWVPIRCRKCKGFKRLWYKPGSIELKQAQQITPGLFPSPHKFNNRVSRR